MQVPVADIKVKKRVRQAMGDLSALADSMNRIGQISPIVITENNALLAGGRRLAAAKLLGWRTINAIVAKLPDGVNELEFEIEENAQRLDFTPEETGRARKRLYRLQHPWFLRRFWNWLTERVRRLFNR